MYDLTDHRYYRQITFETLMWSFLVKIKRMAMTCFVEICSSFATGATACYCCGLRNLLIKLLVDGFIQKYQYLLCIYSQLSLLIEIKFMVQNMIQGLYIVI